MWFSGAVEVPRQTLFNLKSVNKNASWHPKKSPYDVALNVNPYAFAYAAMRTSIVGTHIGLRGSIAGGGLAIAAASYLNPTGINLEFHPRFSNVKDFIGTGIKGTVGAAFSYLHMLNNGYVWAGHWEDAVATSISGPHPDFIFASKFDVCMMDAKGSSKNSKDVDDLVKKEWKRQIWPNKAQPLIFGGTCTEGSIIATRVAPGITARFVKAHGKFVTSTSTSLTNAIKSVQRANYINACFFLGLSSTAFSMLSERGEGSPLVLRNELKNFNVNKNGILVGPPRLIVGRSSSGGSYLMRPIAHIEVLTEMISGLYAEKRSHEVDLPPPILKVGNENRPKKVLIQGGDAVGAEFTLLDN